MTTLEQVLMKLEECRGSAISGQALARQLGVSRTAVWKAVEELRAQGHIIHAVPNRGYGLDAASDVLSVPGVRCCRQQDLPLEVYPQIGSTNSRAKELAAAGAPHGTLVVADSQTAGRGRRGRSFESPAGTGLYLSMVVRSVLPMERVVLVTSAAAVAVCRAVEKTCGVSLDIKWVNDLYHKGKKCCGILTEAAADLETGGLDYLVVGVGINLLPPANGWPEELQSIAGAVLPAGALVNRCQLAAAIARELMQVCEELPGGSFMQEYRARNLVPGRDIQILQNGKSRPAHAESITDEGHLLVTLPDGSREEVNFGEVSVRMQ